MANFILSFVSSFIDLINMEWFQYLFFTFVGVGAVSFINYLVWGK